MFKYMKQKLIKLKRKKDKLTIQIEDINISISVTYKTHKKLIRI